MHIAHWRVAHIAALALVLACGPVHADGQKKAARAAPRLKVQEAPSHETPTQRDRRLQRECKGRPNAGACLGYAS